MDRKELYYKTACLLGFSMEEIEQFCMGGDEQSLRKVSPEQLVEQIKEYLGENNNA
jgi:hypothetical protein